MNPSVQKFAYDIINDVFILYKSRPAPITLISKNDLTIIPVLYNQRCKYVTKYFFTHYKESLLQHYVKQCKNFDKSTFTIAAEKLIYVSKLHHQCSEVLYRLCAQLAIMGAIYFDKGCTEGVSFAVSEIITLATKAYLTCDLDEKYDYLYNFSYDTLNLVFNWAGREINLRDLSRLILDSSPVNYFAIYQSYFLCFLQGKGKSFLNKSNAPGSNLKTMTREAFMFRIQDWCDDYCGELGHCDVVKQRTNFLDISMHISLLTLHAFETLYPSDLKLAHGILLKLAILTTRYGILNFEIPNRSENSDIITIT